MAKYPVYPSDLIFSPASVTAKLRWWVYTEEDVEKFQRWLATTLPPATIGRVWWGRDGLFYWCCVECTEAWLCKRPGWQDIEAGGRSETIATGNDYIKAHYAGGSCVARYRRR